MIDQTKMSSLIILSTCSIVYIVKDLKSIWISKSLKGMLEVSFIVLNQWSLKKYSSFLICKDSPTNSILT